MTLKSKLDTLKVYFKAGKPPYNVLHSVIEVLHRALPNTEVAVCHISKRHTVQPRVLQIYIDC